MLRKVGYTSSATLIVQPVAFHTRTKMDPLTFVEQTCHIETDHIHKLKTEQQCTMRYQEENPEL